MKPPYVTAEYVLRRTQWSAESFGLTDTEFSEALDDILLEESERIEGYVGVSAHFEEATDTDEIHPTIRAELVTLVRHALAQIKTQGLSSSNSGDGSSQSWRPPQEILDTVNAEVSSLDLPEESAGGTGGSYVDVI